MSVKSTDSKVSQNEVETSAQPVITFTDKQLSDLYLRLKGSYHSAETINENYDRMGSDLFAEFLDGGIYADMPLSEQKKIYTVFTMFLNAQPHQGSTPNVAYQFQSFHNRVDNDRTNFSRQNFELRAPYVIHHHYQQSNYLNDYFFWYWVFSMSNTPSSQKSAEQFLMLLVGIIVAVIVSIVLYFTACYLFTVLADALERFWHNEGWFQASISLLGVIGGAVAGAMLMMTVIQPFGALAILCIASASIVAAALTAGLTNVIQAECIEAMNADALDPADPYRFALTTAESVALELKGIDPTKVKCAIAALRDEIAVLPPVSSRWFSDDASPKQEKLQVIRALRRGELVEVDVARLHFNLLSDEEVVQRSNDAAFSRF